MPRGGRNRFGGVDSEIAMLGLDKSGNPVFPSPSQSLTNVMGFQAGGLNLLSPQNQHQSKQPTNELQLQIIGQLNSHSELPSNGAVQRQLDLGSATAWNRGYTLGEGTPTPILSPFANGTN